MTNLSLKIKIKSNSLELNPLRIKELSIEKTLETGSKLLQKKDSPNSQESYKFKNSNWKNQERPAKILEISKIGTLEDKKVSLPAKKNITEYQAQFKAKQIFKKFYGDLSENEFKNLKKTQKNFTLNLEKRLDVVIFRLGFARSIFEARTLIKEKQVKLNDKLVNPAAYNQLIKLGSKISIEPSNKTYLAKIKHLKLNWLKLPTHLLVINQNNLNLNSLKFEGYFLKTPSESEIMYPYNFPITKLN